MRTKIIIVLILSLLTVATEFGQKTKTPKVIQGNICGNPNIKCNTDSSFFVSNNIQFEIPKNSVIFESKPFYAIILKSYIAEDLFGGEETCKAIATEDERLEVQKLFPNNKVFFNNCEYEGLYYTGLKQNSIFMAVYGGTTLAQANKFLKVIQNSGEFEGAYIKKLQAQFNGT